MQRLCAWCGADLGTPAESRLSGAVGHGICAACYAELDADAGIPIAELLASMEEPVLLVDAEHTIGMANRAALELTDERDATGAPDGVLGERPGTVFECENAYLPGGCGRTIHCSGCAIRRAVACTCRTGEPQLDVPATLRVARDPTVVDAKLRISTVGLGDRVMLRVRGLT
ncbi:MAG: hypothetical protein ACOCUW_00015 [Gemmatimonadota bacterium]